MSYAIRLCRPDEVMQVCDIETRAGELFRTIGMNEVANHSSADVAFVRSFLTGGYAHVAVQRDDDTPVGFCLTGLLDGGGHIYEVSVDPKFGRQGLGRRLVESACDAVYVRGATHMTLSTFKDVPWNAPFYAQLGFELISPDTYTPGLVLLSQRERASGMPMSRRCMMRKTLRAA